MEKIILASASPRRRELLALLGLEFEIMVSEEKEDNIDKTLPPDIYTNELAVLKAVSVAKKLIKDRNESFTVISADTVVYCDGKILGKPADEEDAIHMLSMLSDKVHSVYTGFCVLRTSDNFMVSKSVKTDVCFKKLTDEMIFSYVKTGEPMDKAGAYAIQGKGAVLIDKIDGDFFNVVGLPIATLCDVLCEDFGINIF